jgi:hypothetical protein
MQAPVLVMSRSRTTAASNRALKLILCPYNTDRFLADTQSGERQTGRKAQLSNITAAKT